MKPKRGETGNRPNGKTNPTCESADASESYVTISRALTSGGPGRGGWVEPFARPGGIDRYRAIWVSQALEPAYKPPGQLRQDGKTKPTMKNSALIDG
ncbi:MAG: hypothetical protein IT537_21560 [Hyphomicrobiales bacterium]|nr:hypothetical protein [Hyphomicrobiales bacterium]